MTVGILGGGQLGRMLAMAAAELGLSCHVYCPDPDSPAFAVAGARTIAPYEDEAGAGRLRRRGRRRHLRIRERAGGDGRVSRRSRAGLSQAEEPRGGAGPAGREGADGRARHCRSPPSQRSTSQTDIYSALARTGRPAILKTRRLGYDGKGQATIRSGDDLVAAWRAIGEAPAVLEAFDSVRAGDLGDPCPRRATARCAPTTSAENRHVDGILAETSVPANVTPETAAEAVAIAEKIATALGHVGVLAVEMFVVAGPRTQLLVNEIAPRVHNSGHWTSDAASPRSSSSTSAPSPAGRSATPTATRDVMMPNLIGDGGRQLGRNPGRAGRPAAPLRQGRGPAGPQDGPRQPPQAGREAVKRRPHCGTTRF